MRPWFPLGILLGTVLVSTVSAQGNRAGLEGILRAEDTRAPSASALSVLTNALESRDLTVLRRAIRALGRLERPSLAPRLFPLLGHADAGVRGEAAQAVAQAAQGFRSDSSMARGALWTAILDSLGERAGRERDSSVRAMLALSLGRLPYVAPGEIRSARERLLAFEESDVARAMETLSRNTARQFPLEAAFLARLRPLARDEAISPEDRRHALGGLLAGQAADDTTLTRAMRSRDPWLRRLAATGLGRMTASPLRDSLVEGSLEDASPAVRLEGLRVWARLATATGCPRLLSAADDSVPPVSLLAIDLLGTTCANDARVTQRVRLISGERSGGWHRRAHALVSLARLSPEDARPLLAGAGSDSIWQVRMYAARGLALLRDTAGLRGLAGDGAPNVREAAITGLHEIAGHGGDAEFRAALGAPDYQLVLTAAGALAGSPARKEAQHALLTALDWITREGRETSRDPRVAILARLHELGEPALSERLERYRTDFDPAVADSAAVILAQWRRVPVKAAPRPRIPTPVSLAAIEALRGRRLRVTMASGGIFEVELYVDDAPATVLRVARLVRRRYYDGLTFHRVVPNFVIQGGSPGANEYMGDGPFMRDELASRSHERGTLGISTRGRDTGDAQWFVNLVDNPRLDYEYTVWGRVVGPEGMAVLDTILEGEVIRRVEIR